MERRLDLSSGSRAVARALLVAAVTVAALARPADAEDADALFKKAVSHYKASEFKEAAALFARVYKLEPKVDVQFAWAQSERFADNCTRALELLDELLAKKLSKANRKAVTEAREKCNARVAELEAKRAAAEAEVEKARAAKAEAEADKGADDPEPEPEPGPVASADPDSEPAVAIKRQPPRDSTPAWYTDPIGGALVGAGVVGVGVGVALYMSGRSADRDAAATESYTEFLELSDRAESRGKLGVVGLAAGGALIAAGVVWYALDPLGRGDAGETAVSGWVDPGGGGVSVSARF